MSDACQVKVLNGVEVQENGIIRNSKGRIIARLVDSVDFDSEHLEQTKPLSDDVRLDFTKAYFNIHPDAHLSEQFKIKLYELDEFAKTIEERHGIK